MSWNADRYAHDAGIHRTHESKDKHKPTDHHVPPQSVGSRYILVRPQNQHEAYHTLFGNAASYEECCAILLRRWWTPE